jgi:hypothetical protein
MDDRLEGLTQRLAALERAPVSEHPAVLEAVHAALVAELEALAQRAPGPGVPDGRQRR